MKRISLIVAAFVLVSLVGAFPGSSARNLSGAVWSRAIEVPGAAALNAGGSAWVRSVSCPAVGKCAAGGSYRDGAGRTQAFVVDEKNRHWGAAIELPGSASLNAGGIARVRALSCGAPRDCVAAGSYLDGSRHSQAFVAVERKGVWHSAIELPGTAALNLGGNAAVYSLSCRGVGQCTAGGYYTDGSGHNQALVASETNGVWGPAVEVPGTDTLNVGGKAVVYSVSCSAAGECAAAGYYTDGSHHSQAFVASETAGVWGAAIEVPGTASLNAGVYAAADDVSCVAVGECTASGHYQDVSGHFQVFVVSETAGVWGAAIEMPGSAALNVGGYARLRELSCSAVGECSAGGFYLNGSGKYQVFVVNEKKGVWGNAREVPGSAGLNAGGDARMRDLSCGAVGNCAAAGLYTDGSGHLQVFVVTEKKGRWGKAIEVPGTAALNVRGSARVYTVSCAKANECAAGGSYRNGSGFEPFVVEASAPCYVPHLVGKTVRAARKALVAAHCRVGKITRVYANAKRGRIVHQRPRAGRRLLGRSKVALTVSKGLH